MDQKNADRNAGSEPMTNVPDKVRNAIQNYEAAVTAIQAERLKLGQAETAKTTASRELVRQLGNNYPGKSVIYGGKRYGLRNVGHDQPALEVVGSNEIVLD